MSDPAELFLQPECCADPAYGRLHCEDDAPTDCEDGHPWVRYVLAPPRRFDDGSVLRFMAPGPWITRNLRECVLAVEYDAVVLALTNAMADVFRYADTQLRLQPAIREAGRLVAEMNKPSDNQQR